MADKKISELSRPEALKGSDVIPVVNDHETKAVPAGVLNLFPAIPQPRIKIQNGGYDGKRDQKGKDYNNHDQVYAFWEDTGMSFWEYAKELKPEFWLYRYRGASIKITWNSSKSSRRKLHTKKRFVHPVHLDGHDFNGMPFYGGRPKGAPKLLKRETQWSIGSLPFLEKKLDIQPWLWFKGFNSGNAFSQEYKNLPMLTGTTNLGKKLQVFKLRIAIDNPDINERKKIPKIFGPFSDAFILYPSKEFGKYRRFKYFLESEAAPQLRRKLRVN